jgi:Glycosyltransferase family 87
LIAGLNGERVLCCRRHRPYTTKGTREDFRIAKRMRMYDRPIGRLRHVLLWLLSAALLMLGAARIARGYQQLLHGGNEPDLYLRWKEMRYLYKGQNPNDLAEAAAVDFFSRPLPADAIKQLRYAAAYYAARKQAECPRDCRIDPDIGPLNYWEGTYPGWSYFNAAPFVLPTSWRVARVYFCFVDGVALAFTTIWVYRLGRSHSRAGGVFLAASMLAMFANYRVLDRGQYGFLVNALLIGTYYFMEKQGPVAAGVLYGLAAIKPQSSALVAVVFLVRRQWKLLAAATVYLVLASVCVWALSKTDPLEMLKQAIDAGSTRANDGGSSSFLSLAIALDVDRRLATRVLAVLGLVATGAIAWMWRDGTSLAMFAIATTVGRLWTYHHSYDNVSLIFLLVALGKAMLMRNSFWTAAGFWVVGASLWTPPRLIPGGGTSLAGQVCQMMSWMAGLTILLAGERAAARSERTSETNEQAGTPR